VAIIATEIVGITAAGTITAIGATKVIEVIAATEVTTATHQIIATISAENRRTEATADEPAGFLPAGFARRLTPELHRAHSYRR